MRPLDLDSTYESIGECRTCLSTDLDQILDLGVHPLANSLLDHQLDPEILVPLILIRCINCTTVQLSVNVRPELMFQNYFWVTGTTQTARSHCESLAKLIIKKLNLKSPRALEIGSNDGTLLQSLVRSGAKEAIGVDPAINIQPKNLSTGIRLYPGFFSLELAKDIASKYEKVDVVIARNVLSHVPNLNDVMQGIKEVIHENGIIVVEFHDASKIITELHYDSIYHEHTFYHSIKSIQAALLQVGFNIFDISDSPISGGSHVVYASQKLHEPTLDFKLAIAAEESIGVYTSETWERFSKLTQSNLSLLRKLLSSESDTRWVAFGASARSSTLLNSIGKAAQVIDSFVDNNPLKQGKYSPGLRIPILNPRTVIDESVDKIFICAFNFEEEIIAFLKNELNWHGEVILPLPTSIRRYKI